MERFHCFCMPDLQEPLFESEAGVLLGPKGNKRSQKFPALLRALARTELQTAI
jgi:hypothetical protein